MGQPVEGGVLSAGVVAVVPVGVLAARDAEAAQVVVDDFPAVGLDELDRVDAAVGVRVGLGVRMRRVQLTRRWSLGQSVGPAPGGKWTW